MARFDRTWSQFVLDATIPTLLGRLNHRVPSDFFNRIVSVKRSTSPSPDHFRDGQSVSILIRNVLQKLTQATGNENEYQHKTKKRVNERLKH